MPSSSQVWIAIQNEKAGDRSALQGAGMLQHAEPAVVKSKSALSISLIAVQLYLYFPRKKHDAYVRTMTIPMAKIKNLLSPIRE